MTDCQAPFWHPAFAEGFILDWDGVLAETALNFRPIREKYFGGRMVPLMEAGQDLPPPLREQLNDDIYRLEMEGASKAVAVPGAYELIEWIGSTGRPWCVVSRNCRDSIDLAAATAKIPLPSMVRSRETPPVKPEPEALWAAAESMRVPPDQCVMIGDFIYDLVGARRASVRAVLVQRPDAEWYHWADVSFATVIDFVKSLKSPIPLVPWEYAPFVRKRGAESLARYGRCLVHLDGEDPLLLVRAFDCAERGVLRFLVGKETLLSAEQWRTVPGLEPGLLHQPLSTTLSLLLRRSYPLAKVVLEADDRYTPYSLAEMERLFSQEGL